MMVDARGSDDVVLQLTIPGAEPGHGLQPEEIRELVTALLFASPAPPTVAELAAGADLRSDEIERALTTLTDGAWGLTIQRHGDRVALVTAPRFAGQVRRLLGLDREAKLSQAALETLAIIAWRQPVTRSEIEAVRGVDCSGVIATLHARDLIEGGARRATVGNPIEYGTTPTFLQHFGLSSLADLPGIGTIDGQPGDELLAMAVSTASAENAAP